MTTQSFLNGQTALVSLGASVPGVFARGVAAAANEGNPRNKTLVIVQLAGGVDGLNTVVPYKDGAYRDARPQMGVPAEQLLPLNERAALHPALGKLKALSAPATVALAKGAAFPSRPYWHFKAR